MPRSLRLRPPIPETVLPSGDAAAAAALKSPPSAHTVIKFRCVSKSDGSFRSALVRMAYASV